MPRYSADKYNPYFTIPLLIWVVAGAVALTLQSKDALFFFFNTHYSPLADQMFYYITLLGQAEVIIPVLIGLMLLPAFRNRWYLILASACNLIPFFVQQLLKSYFDCPRPRAVYEDNSLIHYLPDWPVYLTRSFPSGHSAGAFSFFCFLSLMLPARYRPLGLLFFMLALLVCYSRIYLAAHFFGDTYAGSLIGGFLTLLIFNVLNHYKSTLFNKGTIIEHA